MERAARPCIAAAAVFAAGGLIAATPVISSSPDAQLSDYRLTADSALSEDSILQGVLDQQFDSDSGSTVTDNVDASDHVAIDQYSPAADLGDLVPDAAGHNDLSLALGQLFDDAYALLRGAGGGLDPESLTFLQTFQPDVGGPELGGFGAAADQNTVAPNALAALFGADVGDNALAAALLSEANAFNQALLLQEQDFNTALVEHEQALQDAVFGDDHALNGVVNHAFNVFNMIYALQQQGVNFLLGVDYDPQELAQLLLVADGPDGDQLQALMAAIADLQGVDLDDVFANYDPEEVQAALDNLFATMGGGPFGDAFDLSDGSSALTNLLDGVGGLFDATP